MSPFSLLVFTVSWSSPEAEFTWANPVVAERRARGLEMPQKVYSEPEGAVLESPQTRERDTTHSPPSAQGSEKGQAEQPRKAKKLTMFGRLGAYQRRWGQAAAEATQQRQTRLSGLGLYR